MLLDAQLSVRWSFSDGGREKFFNLRYTACPDMYACVVSSTLETPCKSYANSLVKKIFASNAFYVEKYIRGPKCFETRPFIRTTVKTQLYATARKYVEKCVYETHGE